MSSQINEQSSLSYIIRDAIQKAPKIYLLKIIPSDAVLYHTSFEQNISNSEFSENF